MNSGTWKAAGIFGTLATILLTGAITSPIEGWWETRRDTSIFNEARVLNPWKNADAWQVSNPQCFHWLSFWPLWNVR